MKWASQGSNLAADPLVRFSNRAAAYVKHRPSYPAQAIDFVLEGLTSTMLLAADIGAGTGISSRLLADRGVCVKAIEPNRAMREAAEPHEAIEVRDGTGESTGLPSGSVDLVTCFQSFHWLRSDEAMAEFRRVLRRPGRVALVWNFRESRDPFTAAYGACMTEVSADAKTSIEHAGLDADLLREPWFSDRTAWSFESKQRLDLEALLGRARSSSYLPLEGPVYEQCMRRMHELFERYADDAGCVELVYATTAFRADVK